ncbi:MAG: hypothetical protein KJ063_25195 [Anaerolineae bacterium]|nr:hypothetical protein [Anaerolineae bacterium]
MRIFEILLTGEIHWKIHRNDPEKQNLLSLPGCFFVNPLLYSKFTFPQPGIRIRALGITTDMVIVSTSGIVLGTNLDSIDISSIPFEFEQVKFIKLENSPDSDDSDISIVPVYSERLTVSLRQASKQVDIPKSLVSFHLAECTELPKLDFPRKITDSVNLLQKYIWDTAASWNHLLIADAEIVNLATPIYEKLLLDAIHAFRDRDYRRALLYAAISIESLTATKLDGIYADVTQGRISTKDLRVISSTQKGGIPVLKDPVYEFLFEKGKFAERLHQIPLYLTGKSLFVENEALYQKAIKLYRTRNKIAHLGEPPSGEQSYFEMNEEDGIAAIECAIEIMQWFGEQTNFPLPKLDFVKIHSPREAEIP